MDLPSFVIPFAIYYGAMCCLIFYAFNGRVVRYVKMQGKKRKKGVHPHQDELDSRRDEYKSSRECPDTNVRRPTVFDKPPKVTVNAFVNSTWAFPRSTHLVYCLCGPITIPIRLAVLIPALIISLAFSKLSTIGLNTRVIVDGSGEPFAAWRRLMAYPVKICGRMLLFTFGVVWISVKGKRAKAKDAPLIISNHICFMDPIYLVSQSGASPVSASSNMSIPLFGNLTKMFQPILVDRASKDSGKDVAKKIKDRATSGGKWPQTVLFPEGLTTNGQALTYFKLGAFTPNVPVQPVLCRYNNKLTDLGWVDGGPGVGELAFKCLCSPWINMSVEYLPPYVPNEAEKEDTHLFARNVRQVMADKLQVPVTEQCFDDVLMMAKARQLHVPVDQAVVNLRDIRKVMDLSLDDAKKLLERFGKSKFMSKDGHLSEEGFLELMGEECKDREHLKRLFVMVDKEGHGWIDFRDYVLCVTVLNGGDKKGIDSALELTFKSLDVDGRGGLSEEQLRGVLRMVWPELSVVEGKQFFDEADTNKDGMVSLEEFTVLCHSHESDLPKFRDALFGLHANEEAERGKP